MRPLELFSVLLLQLLKNYNMISSLKFKIISGWRKLLQKKRNKIEYWDLNLNVWIPTRIQLLRCSMLGADVDSSVIFHGFAKLDGKLSNLSIGANSTLNSYVYINCRSKVSIGENVRLSVGSQIHTAYLIDEESYPYKRSHDSKPVTIGDNVWIAANAIIMPGVSICDNCTIAAGSILNQNANISGIWAGVPAKIKKEF